MGDTLREHDTFETDQIAGGKFLLCRLAAIPIKVLTAQCTIHISESTRCDVAVNYLLASALITDSWSKRVANTEARFRDAGVYAETSWSWFIDVII